jgi:hypothetical protein
MFDMHHIISDGSSLGIISREFMALYAGEELPALPVQYKDYAAWQGGEKQSEILKRQEEYWLGQFSDGAPVLNLPLDYARPTVQSFAGRSVSFEILALETASLNKLARDQGATLYMVLLAIFNILLARLSGRQDIVIGTPTAGRRHVDLQGIIGMFINTLSMRNFPAGEKNFSDFLQEVKTNTLAAFENQEYQFEDMVEKLDITRDAGRNPMFDVMFALQNMDITAVEVPGLKLTSYEYENKTAKFDIILMGFEVQDRLEFYLEYSTELFKQDTIERFIGYFKDVIAAVSENSEIMLNDINISCDLVVPESKISHEIDGDFGF